MNSIVRMVTDLSADERHVYESVLGQPLQNDQKIILQLVSTEGNGPSEVSSGPNALEPYAMWADLSDEEIAELESEIPIRSESRQT